MISKDKYNELWLFILAYVWSYFITFFLFIIKDYVKVSYIFIFGDDFSSLFEAYSTINIYYSDALFSPVVLPLTATILSFRYPEYLILVVAYGLFLYGVYKIKSSTKNKRLFFMIIVLLIMNFIGIKTYPLIMKNMIA